MATQHSELRARATVSIWLGNFRTVAELDDYMRKHFVADFGFAYESAAGPEARAHPGEPISVRELLLGFSMSRRFIDGAVDCAAERGWSVANSVVIFYSTRYDPRLAGAPSARLQFVGAVELLPRT